MVVADLHVHTSNSDGTRAVADLPGAARTMDLEAVAVTDHDRPHPALSRPVVQRDGVTVVHGIELRVDAGDQRVDLLGYGLERTDALERECARIQRDRVERAQRMVARLEDRLGVDLDVEAVPGVGRPHVARAIADHPGLDLDVDAAFDRLIGDGRPCYVARDVPSFERGRALLAESCRLVGLAHPLRYDDPAGALEHAPVLDAVERYYPYERPVDPADSPDPGLVDRAIQRHDLLATGGSDAHGAVLGAAGLTESSFAPVRQALLE